MSTQKQQKRESESSQVAGDRIVVVDDEQEMANLLGDVLRDEGFEAEVFTIAEKALKSVSSVAPALVITDFKMGDMDGMTLLQRIKAAHPEVPVILITAFGSIDLAIEATRMGAYHFITKPFRMKEVLLVVERALTHRRVQRENKRLRREVQRRYRFGGIIGKSRPMQNVFSLIERVAATNSNVLILGESGTGKELVAKAIHYNSVRKDHPFVAVNCSALPEGLLESELFGHVRGAFTGAHANKQGLFQEATRGTLFLDEIGDMPMALQAKLLRAIQEKSIRPVGGNREIRISTRIVAATHRDLRKEVREATFREDLYYRLSVIPVRLPPLRERLEDIPLLVNHFLDRVARDMNSDPKEVSSEAMRALMRYPWEGNVRELENVIERAHVLSPGRMIGVDDVIEELRHRSADPVAEATDGAPPWDDLPTLQELERRYIIRVLRITGGNKEKAASILGIDRRTLYRWRMRYALDKAAEEGAI